MEFLINWGLRGIYLVLGGGAAVWITRWLRANWRGGGERWPVRIAIGMVGLVGLYALAHARLLAERSSIERGREEYAVFGDPRRAELRRGEVRGWILDCTGQDDHALAYYRDRDGVIDRAYSLGNAGANFLGGGEDADARDYTVEVLFAPELRQPRSFREWGQLHAAGTDLDLTLCRDITAEAYRGLVDAGRPGAVVVQDVRTGAVLAYAATGTADDPPLGVKQYAPPGSTFKLALTAVWWENGLPDDIPIPCPAEIQITPRATIENAGHVAHGELIGPVGMLVPSCNTAAVWMALRMREEIGTEPFVEAYRRFGFLPYQDTPPADSIGEFWRTTSSRWSERMTPAPSRIRISEETGDAEWGQLAIGQGPVDVTVLGISRFIQSIANGGVMLPPTLEMELARDPPRGERVMTEETARKLQAAMRAVVDRGTGTRAAQYLGGTGWDIGGKTGTAQVPGQRDDGWFVGILFDPDGQPRYTVVSFLKGGGPGGSGPALIAARVARTLVDETPTILDDR